MHKHVLLITSTNLACNPRSLKEVRLLNSMGIKVSVVAFHLHNWTDEKEKELNKEFPDVNFHYIESTRINFVPWLFASLLEKYSKLFCRYFPSNIFLQSIAISKRSWQLKRELKKWNKKSDLIIAHNPPAFYPAKWFAKKTKTPFAIDVEDYHPGEGDNQQKSMEILMSNVLPQAAYISYASQLIKTYTEKLLPQANTRSFIIRNLFPEKEFQLQENSNKDKLKIVWFSQNIDVGRGVEEFVEAFQGFEDSMHLTLIGNPRESFCKKYLDGKKGITIIPSLHSAELNKMIADFDIGLAIEPGKDLNNKIALSNKILTYFQAGVYILASDTEAQILFLKEYPDHGIYTSLSKEKLSEILENILKNSASILLAKAKRFEEAKSVNWENESAILKSEWKELLQ